MLAVATAVNSANAGTDGSQHALLDGFQAAVVVSVIAAVLGAVVTAVRFRSQPAAAPVATLEPEVVDAEPEAEAA